MRRAPEDGERGVAELAEELYATLLEEDEELALLELLRPPALATELELDARASSRGSLGGGEGGSALERVEAKLQRGRELIAAIWQLVKGHERELRKSLDHRDEELAMLLHPLEKEAPRDQNTQTSLRLPAQATLEYSFSFPTATLNPLSALLAAYPLAPPTLDFQAASSLLQDAVLARLEAPSPGRFAVLFREHLFQLLPCKSEVVRRLHQLKAALRLAAREGSSLAAEFAQLLGLGGRQTLSSQQERLWLQGVKFFREMLPPEAV